MKGTRIKKLVLFGAGKIGRSFIGQLFSRAGYEVVFVDIVEPVIRALNQRHAYSVIIKADNYQEELVIANVRAVHAADTEKVVDEICTADILATAVGVAALPAVIPLLSQALLKRCAGDKMKKIDIIIAENMRDAARYFKTEIQRLTGPSYPCDDLVGLVETSIGKMVPIMSEKEQRNDILQVFAEPYNTLIVDKKGFKNRIPDVPGIAPQENIKAWVDRKSFIHNLGHAATAYIGYVHNPRFVYVYQALAVPEIYQDVYAIMRQAAEILVKVYPRDFSLDELTGHIDDLLQRFRNKALGDTIYRVGKDLLRKLGPDDRIVGCIKLGRKHGMLVDKILYALVCGMYFRAPAENGEMFERDTIFVTDYFSRGISSVLVSLCGFDEQNDNDIITECEQIAARILSNHATPGKSVCRD